MRWAADNIRPVANISLFAVNRTYSNGPWMLQANFSEGVTNFNPQVNFSVCLFSLSLSFRARCCRTCEAVLLHARCAFLGLRLATRLRVRHGGCGVAWRSATTCRCVCFPLQAVLTNADYVAGTLTSSTIPGQLQTFTFMFVWTSAYSETANIVATLPAGVAVDRVGNPSIASPQTITLGTCVWWISSSAREVGLLPCTDREYDFGSRKRQCVSRLRMCWLLVDCVVCVWM